MSNYVFGKKATFEYIEQNKIIEVYYFNWLDEFKKFKNVKFIKKDKTFFNNFSINHQNIIGLLKNNCSVKINENFENFLSSIKNKNKTKSIILMLDEIQDPGNFGAICRTCNAFDVDGIIFKKNNQVQVNETVIKTSLGSALTTNFLRVSNLQNTIEQLKKHDYWSICTSLENRSVELSKFKTSFDKIVLIMGNEENGVSSLIQKKADVLLKIKMEGTVQSLNVSVTTGIFLHYLKNL